MDRNQSKEEYDQYLNECRVKLRTFLEEKKYKSIDIIQVTPNYYDENLTWRKNALNAPNEKYLCKTIVFENKHWKNSRDTSVYNPKYICVIVQYAAKLNMIKLHQYGRQIQNKFASCEANQIGRAGFHYRLVKDSIQAELTGYKFNGVTPFNFVSKENIPIILSDKLVELDFFYLGGGHPDLKLRVSVDEFITKSEQRVFVADVSDERPQSEWNNKDDEESSSLKQDSSSGLEQ